MGGARRGLPFMANGMRLTDVRLTHLAFLQKIPPEHICNICEGVVLYIQTRELKGPGRTRACSRHIVCVRARARLLCSVRVCAVLCALAPK